MLGWELDDESLQNDKWEAVSWSVVVVDAAVGRLFELLLILKSGI